jgi:hypothetical protein
MNLVFGLAGPYGHFHPVMSIMHHLDPEFLSPQEMIMAYASQVHHIPNLPTSASNVGMKPGVLCTMGRVETFSQRVQALYDSGGSRCMSPYKPDFDPDSLRPSTVIIKVMGGALKANQMEGTLRWSGVTDDGVEAPFLLEHSLYVPHGDTRIFSPQHWAQNMLKLHPKCETDSHRRRGQE